jgi:hypothetical protein
LLRAEEKGAEAPYHFWMCPAGDAKQGTEETASIDEHELPVLAVPSAFDYLDVLRGEWAAPRLRNAVQVLLPLRLRFGEEGDHGSEEEKATFHGNAFG